MSEVIHRCPPLDSGIMPCCGKAPFDVSPKDRMTVLDPFVTCEGSAL